MKDLPKKIYIYINPSNVNTPLLSPAAGHGQDGGGDCLTRVRACVRRGGAAQRVEVQQEGDQGAGGAARLPVALSACEATRPDRFSISIGHFFKARVVPPFYQWH